jgi:cytochrome c553
MQIQNKIKTTALAMGLLALGLGSVANTYAAPSSNVAWTSETRNLIKNADIANGEKIAKKCGKCHGDDGTDPTPIEDEDTPFLAGQIAHATYKQIIDYQDKTRDDKAMLKKVKDLSKQDVADVSAFYATQALPMPSVDPSTVTPEAIRMVTRGDGTRFLPPCAGCHGLNGEGSIVDVPALAGQSTSYFITTMTAYKDEDRENDIYSRMRYIAAELTEQEITELADYYASIGTGTELLVVESDEETDANKVPIPPKEPTAPKSPEAPAS